MKINELELLDVSGGFESNLFNYGSMRDTIGHFDYTFTPGVYVVKGECGLGGWALTEILTGRDSNCTGIIRVNGNEIDSAHLRKYACYVGDDLNTDKKRYWGKKTIRKQITNAIDKKVGYGKVVEDFTAESCCLDFQFLDRGNWGAIVHGVAKSQTRLSD